MTEADELDLPPAHPRFAAHFTDPLYDDQDGEFAPFGTDEGADVLAEWIERQLELEPAATLRTLLAEEADDVDELLADQARDPDVGVDAGIIGAGFTLLRLTGQIDTDGRQTLNAALTRTIDFYGAQPELVQMREDLAAFDS